MRLMEYIQKVFMDCSNARHRPVCGIDRQSACLNQDVGEFVKQREIIEVETPRHQQRILPRNNGETHSSDFPQKIVRNMTKTKLAAQKSEGHGPSGFPGSRRFFQATACTSGARTTDNTGTSTTLSASCNCGISMVF